ncbi:MAG: hypothetical protein IKB88_10540 [Clostridia bacterium]|nr:hypothetical protein [Clostridia bacterium]
MKKRLDLLIPLIIVAVSVVAELIFGNFVYFSCVAGRNGTVDYRPEVQHHTVTAEETQIHFGDLDFPLNSVEITLKSTARDNREDYVSVGIYTLTDKDTAVYGRVTEQKMPLASYETTKRFFCNTNKAVTDVIIAFDGIENSVEITSVTLNPEYRFSFNSVRFGLMMLFGTAIYYYKLRPENPTLSYKKRHRRSLAASITVCVCSTLLVAFLNVLGEGMQPIAYPLIWGVESYDPYVQQFDALMKGQLHLDVLPETELLLLDNPYDPSAREGIYYLWDRAFFGGRYYSYFGIAPLLTVYFPYYFISGNLPDASFVMTVFAVAASVFFALAVEEYAHLSGKNKFGYFPAFCAVSGFLASLILLIMRGQSRFYYIASMAGMAFSAAFIYFMLKAVGSRKTVDRIAFFLLSGLSFGLGFLSRVNSVLPLAAVSAAFVIIRSVNRIREKKSALLALEAAALGMPVAAAIAVSMTYNKMRFGAFFDFGTDYQLTVADTSQYSVGLFGLIPSLFHYFIQNFCFTAEFPFIGFEYVAAADYGRYVYIDNGIGIFAMPFTLMLLACPLFFKKKTVPMGHKIIFGTALAMLPITAFLDFCLGGVIFRYTADISLLAAFLAAVIALECADSILEKFGKNGYDVFKKCIFALGGANALTAFGTATMLNGNLVSPAPVAFEMLKDIFVFWN